MSASEETLYLLGSIDASLKTLVRLMSPAPAVNLDGPYGDPVVKFDPRDWHGEPYKGRHMSACPPDYLDLLATAFDYFADKAERTGDTYNGKPTGPYNREGAAKARGWAARLRNGYHAKTAEPMSNESDALGADAEIGF